LDNVILPLVYSRESPSDIKERAREVLAKVGLEHRLHHTPGQLSGGEQQRVTIARSLINNPPIIFADEPTGNLDSKNGIETMKTFDKLVKEGKTIVLITHDSEVAEHADRIISIIDGEIASDTKRQPSNLLGNL
jgi:ABC-type lipoprotein export system ATPase subunit